MNARLVSQLVRLYPQAWRTRYAEEFQSFLETHPSNLRTILNVIGGRSTSALSLSGDSKWTGVKSRWQ
jgi:predicted transcriptional regulator with HTH domain